MKKQMQSLCPFFTCPQTAVRQCSPISHPPTHPPDTYRYDMDRDRYAPSGSHLDMEEMRELQYLRELMYPKIDMALRGREPRGRDPRDDRFSDRHDWRDRDDRDSRDRFGDRFDLPGPAFRDFDDAPRGGYHSVRRPGGLPDYKERPVRRQLSHPRDSMPRGDGPPRDVRQTRDDRSRDFNRTKDTERRRKALTPTGVTIPSVMAAQTKDDYKKGQRHENEVGRFFEAANKDYLQVFYITPSTIGKLVGKGGKQMQQMGRDYKVVLQANDAGRIVVRARHLDDVESCSLEVRRITSLWAAFDNTDTRVEVSDEVKMGLLHDSGRYMDDISRETGCKLDVARNRDGNFVRVIGTPEEREAGLAAINKFVEKSAINVNETFMFPLDALRRFIGIGGDHIAAFEKNTGCYVNSNNVRDERVGDLGPLVLTAPPEVMPKAKEKIRELLREWGY